MAQEFKIGRLRYTWKGYWATSTFYNRDAVISYNGKTYVCLIPHTSGEFYADLNHSDPVAGATPYWIIMIEGRSWKGEFTPGTLYTLSNIVLYHGTVYKCITNHTSGATIDLTKWEIYVASNSTWIGDYDNSVKYFIGDTVKYGGIVYRCLTDHQPSPVNTYPNYTNWEILYSGIEYKSLWSESGVSYKINDVVKFGANLWKSTTDHISALPFDDTIWSLWMPGIEYIDTWDFTTVYQPGDVVIYGGYSYISLTVNNTDNTPSVSTSDWQLLTTGYKMQGEWDSASFYAIGSVVRHGGNLLDAVQDNQNQNPLSTTVSTTYTATGSTGLTLKVASTTGITIGMIITGVGFDKGQTVTSVDDANTLTISIAPYDSVVNGQALSFVGVNGTYWKMLIPGVRWKNRWASMTNYIQGDIVVWVNKTYRAVKSHTAVTNQPPSTDTTNSLWVIYLNHDRFNVLNQPGDIIVNSNGNNIALPIGAEGYLIKSIYGVPTWSSFLQTPKVFYVTPTGIDAVTSGTTWDNPYKSINYACLRVAAGTQNSNAKSVITSNKAFIVAEAYAWMTYQIINGLTPFTGSPSIDAEKTKRDSRYLIDAIVYDLSRGGNSQTVAFTYAFFDKEYKDKYSSTTVAAQIQYFIATINHIFDLVVSVVNNIQVSPTYSTSTQLLTSLNSPAQVITDILSYQSIIVTALTAGDTYTIPVENQGLTCTIQVKTGSYYEELPIVLPANTALNGDELRGVTIFPKLTIKTVATRTTASTKKIRVGTTVGMTNGTPVQFVSINPVDDQDTVFGGLEAGKTYYVLGSSITTNEISVSESLNGPAKAVDLVTNGTMYVYGGDALKDMFRVQNGTGIRNMTLSGLLGTLTAPNAYTTRRPTGGTYVSLDPGTGPDDTSVWIYRKSPYIQNVTTFGVGCVGNKIDGTLHNGGNKSMTSNDFTQICSDGIGIWCTGPGALTEAVSVFSYYAYSGYMAENGGRIRATNGNSSYGTFGVIAEGYDSTETPISGSVNNRYYQAQAEPVSSLGSAASILKVQYSHAGESYTTPVTNILNYSNGFTNWSSDSNVTLIQSIVSPYGQSEAWITTGNTSGTDSSYIYQNVNIPASGSSYTGLSGTNLSGGGLGATFDILVTSTAYIVSINVGGSGYVSTNQIQILGSVLGGINGLNDLTITVTGLSGTTITQIAATGIVQVGAKQSYTFSIFCKKGNSSTFDVEAIFSGYSSPSISSGITYNFDTATATPYVVNGGMMPSSYSANSVSGNQVGWYRLVFTFNDAPALNNNLQIRIYPRSKYGNSAYTTFYGAQLEIGTTAHFYFKTNTNRFTSYANFDVVGAGKNVDIIANENRSLGIYQSRVVQDTAGYTGGKDYLTSNNNAQTGNTSSITIAASDVANSTMYLGMRLFINSGTGAGQYGTISSFNTGSKIAYVLKDSFDQMELISTSSSTNEFTISASADLNSLYANQPVRFIPTTYTTPITNVSLDKTAILASTGGTTNLFTIASTARLTIDMPVSFTGTTFGGVTSGYTYYIIAIADDTKFQVSTTLGGTLVFLSTVTPTATMYVNFPNDDSRLQAESVDTMQINLPIYFTGSAISTIVPGDDYYISEIYPSTKEFTISSALVQPTATNTALNTNYITVSPDTSGLTSINPIIFTGTTFGGVVAGTKYYINHIIDSTRMTISTAVADSTITVTTAGSDLITVGSTTGFVIGNPVIITGKTFGGIDNDRVYYVHYVSNATSFSISNTSTPVTVTATQTFANGNITVSSTTNLTPLTPIKFSGTTFGGISTLVPYFIAKIVTAGTTIKVATNIATTLAISTAQESSLITVGSTTGFVANNPIIFTGDTLGGIVSGKIYYVSAINSPTDFTISETPGGNAFGVTTGTGVMTIRTPSTEPTLSAATGTLTAITRYVGSPVTLATATGECAVRTTSGTFAITSTATGSMTGTTTVAKTFFDGGSGTMTGTYKVPIIGGISEGTTYYIRTIGATNTFTVTSTSNGPSDVGLQDSTGSMTMGEIGWDHITPGTSLVSTFDSSTVYSIEPRVTYSASNYAVALTSLTAQAPGSSYVSIASNGADVVALANANTTLSYRASGSSTWTSSSLPTSATWASIAAGNSYWVIISSGGTSIPGSKVLSSNSNIVTWKTSYLPSIGNWSKVVYGNGKFVAITSNSASCAYSTDYGTTWSSGNSLPNTTWSSLAYGRGRYVAVATGGTQAAHSIDGITWVSSTLPRSTTWTSVSFGNDRFVAISSSSGKAAYSLDGITWAPSLYNVSGTVIAYGNGVFVTALDNGGVISANSPTYVSEDGIVWKTKQSYSKRVNAMVYTISPVGLGEFVVIGGVDGNGQIISAGARAKGRAVITAGVMQRINAFEPGGNYSGTPTVAIIDSNATIPSAITLLKGNGVLANPTFYNQGSGYNSNTTTITINGAGYADQYQTGLSLILKNLTKLPRPGDNLTFTGDSTGYVYKVTDAVALDGTLAPNILARVYVSPEIITGTSQANGTAVVIRTQYSQVRLTGHDFLNIGYGNFEQSNYPGFPENTLLSPENETIETNYGRVFYSSTDQDGNFRVGKLFAVEQATGVVTLSASQFGLSGLSQLKLGGVSVGNNSVIITQFSTDQTFVANSNQIIPTQRAIKGYLTSRLSQGGSNTFTGQLIAGTVLVGGPDRITSTVPEDNAGSRVRMRSLVNVHGIGDGANGAYGAWDGDGMALAYFMKSLNRSSVE